MPWAAYGIARTANPCTIPARHESGSREWDVSQALIRADEGACGLDPVLLGEAIPGFSPYVFAAPVDEPHHLLWMLTEGAVLRGVHPKARPSSAASRRSGGARDLRWPAAAG